MSFSAHLTLLERAIIVAFLSVRLSVCLSVKRVDCDKTKQASSEKSSVMTNRKSTMSFPMSLRRTAYVAHKSPKVAQEQKVPIDTLNLNDTQHRPSTASRIILALHK